MYYPISKATIEDEQSIFNLYRKSIKAFESIGIFQWNEEYPTREALHRSLLEGTTWVVKSGDQILAAVTLDSEQDSQYQNIKWAYLSNHVLVIHRVVVDPDHQGKGLARKIMEFSEEFAYQNGYEVIRMDAFYGNPYSQNLYKHMGYHEAIGYCYYHDPKPIMCNCFEKRISL